jgi:hypothetical protein
MVDSTHGELRKPSTAAGKTRKIAADLDARLQRRTELENKNKEKNKNWRQEAPNTPDTR